MDTYRDSDWDAIHHVSCDPMRILVSKSTGKVLEAQSHARYGTLIENAKRSLIDLSDVEEREISPSEYEVMRRAEGLERLRVSRIQHELRENAIAVIEALANKDVLKIEEFNAKQATLRSQLVDEKESINGTL